MIARSILTLTNILLEKILTPRSWLSHKLGFWTKLLIYLLKGCLVMILREMFASWTCLISMPNLRGVLRFVDRSRPELQLLLKGRATLGASSFGYHILFTVCDRVIFKCARIAKLCCGSFSADCCRWIPSIMCFPHKIVRAVNVYILGSSLLFSGFYWNDKRTYKFCKKPPMTMIYFSTFTTIHDIIYHKFTSSMISHSNYCFCHKISKIFPHTG